MKTLKITSVEVHVVRGPAPEPPPGEKQRQVTMIAVYPEHRPPERGPAPVRSDVTESRYLRIGTDLGAEGFYGPVDPETGWSIVHMLTELLIGQDALASTITWDKMERSNRHARHGHLKMAISAVDNALWDLRGQVYDAPVWQLLGGASRERIPAYASMLGTSLAPEVVAEAAKATAAEGFDGQKWFLADGPGGGPEGMRRNVELAEHLRDVLGPDYPIMFDVFMGWDLNYALEWARRVAPVRPTWLEEPFPNNRYPAFLQLHRDTGIPISTGEHLYDRADIVPYLNDGVLVALQTDPEWCGGVTELVRICALAETFGVPVIPHGHGLHAALHVVASQSPVACPKVEYLKRSMPNRHHFEVAPLTPVDGSFALPQGPGFGISLDESKIEARDILTSG